MSEVLDVDVEGVQQEYATVSYVQEMRFEAIVLGALMGMTLTILVLAIINGFKLDFNQTDEVRFLLQRIIELEPQVQQLSAQ